MDNSKFNHADLISAVKACANTGYAGSLLSTSKAIGEFRIIA